MKNLIGVERVELSHQDASNFLSHEWQEVRTCAEELMESGDGVAQYAVLTRGHFYTDNGLEVATAETLSADDNKPLSEMVAEAESAGSHQFHHLTVWQGGLCTILQFMDQ